MSAWQKIGWRRNDRLSSWHGCADAPMTMIEAREVMGMAGHVFATKIEGSITFLVWQPSRRET